MTDEEIAQLQADNFRRLRIQALKAERSRLDHPYRIPIIVGVGCIIYCLVFVGLGATIASHFAATGCR